MTLSLATLLAVLVTCVATTSAADGPAGTSRPSQTNLTTEFEKLRTEDQTAQEEIAKWVVQANRMNTNGAIEARLKGRIEERLAPIQRAYDDFLKRHPDHAGARLAYGDFLNQRQDEAGAQAQWERALELDPKNPEIYNNLAGRYSEIGPAKKAFDYFAKAIELNPTEAGYYHNFADSLYVLRKATMEIYGLNEQQVYAKALEQYRNAARLDATNYSFAFDVAQTYYALRPLPTEEALKAWTNTLQIARTEIERQEVLVHLARIEMLAGRLAEARARVRAVTNESLTGLKERLIRGIEEREKTK